MEGLISVLRAAHARSTHHNFALDALRHLRTNAGIRLARVLLHHHAEYLAGAKDPDTRFRDFQNHVVHVADSNWGGAPRAAERWYGRLQNFLRTESWPDAAHAAGVLSHYFTDPLQPLHTSQSPREAVVHRPLEWSIWLSYSEILERWRDDRFQIVFQLSNRGDWLSSAILRGAELAHRAYETLVSTYDLQAARANPRMGLSEPAMESLAELFGVAITGWARVLERTADEADASLPTVNLLPTTFKATLAIPRALLLRRLENKQERFQVEQLLDHYMATGQLAPYVPEEVALVRKVLAIRERDRIYQARLDQAEAEAHASESKAALPPDAERTADEAAPTVIPISINLVESASTKSSAQSTTQSSSEASTEANVKAIDADRASTLPLSTGQTSRQITLASPIVDAPSIGPKTAARLEAIGIFNVGQFLGSAPEEMVRRLRVRWITVEHIADWQAQTRLLMALPWLRVRDAQMLVGIGCRTPHWLEMASVDELFERIDRLASTSLGKRMLRNAAAPPRKELQRWIAMAQQAVRRAA